MPKNLSLPSFRIGPAFINIFSNGVWFVEAASFLFDSPAGLELPFSKRQVSVRVERRSYLDYRRNGFALDAEHSCDRLSTDRSTLQLAKERCHNIDERDMEGRLNNMGGARLCFKCVRVQRRLKKCGCGRAKRICHRQNDTAVTEDISEKE